VSLRSLAVVMTLAAWGTTASPSNAGEPFEVAILLRVDPSIASKRIADRFKDEAESIWRPYGVRLEWTDAAASEPASRGLLLEVNLERDVDRGMHAEWPAVLGRVEMTAEPANRRSIHVSFDATEAALAVRRPLSLPSTTRGFVLDREMAVALGRVLAHEIGHVLLGPPYHDPKGLMRASLPPGELAEPDRTPFRLTCSGLVRLRNRLSALSESAFSVDGASCIAIAPTRRQR